MRIESESRITTKGLISHAILLVVILVIFFPGAFFRKETLVPGDRLYNHPPWRYYIEALVPPHRSVKALEALVLINKFHWMAGDQLREGCWPLWAPYEHGGAPLLANMQSAVFHPPRLLHYFIADGPIATTIYILLTFFLCGMMAYIAAVLLGLPSFAARFVSVAWMLGGYNNLWCYWMEPDVAAWFPLLFLGAEYLLRERFRAGFMLTAAAGSLALLGGHPETAFSFAFFLGVYVLIRLFLGRHSPKRWVQVVSVLGLAWGVALLFTAVQLLPFIEYLFNSPKAAFRSRYSGCELPLRNLTGFWFPLFWDRSSGSSIDFLWANWLFFGLVSWVALAALFVKLPSSGHRKRTLALAASSLIALLVALDAPGFHLLNALPLFRTMWYRYNVAFAVFGLCLLAGTGLAQWFSSAPTVQEKARFRKTLLAGLAFLLALSWFVYARASGMPDEFVFYGQVLATTLTALAALVLFNCGGAVSRNAVLGILLLELAYPFYDNHPTIPRENVYPDTQLTNTLQDFPKPTRISFITGGLFPGLMAYYELEALYGYDAMFPERNFERFRFGNIPGLWAKMEPFCAVQWYLGPQGVPVKEWWHGCPEDARFVDTIDGFDIYENRKAKPRAYLVPAYTRVDPEPLAILGGLADPEYDPEHIVLTDAPPSVPSPAPSHEPPGTATVAHHAPDEVVVKTRATRPCILVLADNHYPGWHVEINGNAAELFPAYTVFRGVVIPAGEHEVRFYYKPFSFRLGMVISVISLISALIWAGMLLVVPRKTFSRAAPQHISQGAR